MKDNTKYPVSLAEIVRIGETYRSLPPALRKKIDTLSQRVPLSQQKTLTIGVVGAFTRGKSSFINALLGIEILPTNLLPATAIPHVLVYGDELRIWSIQKKQKRTREDLQALARYTALRDPNATEVISLLIEVPSNYLSRNLRIIDTPGIGAVFSEHYKISIRCIQECDLAIVVLSSEPLISEVECQFIDEIKNKVSELIFLQTKIDREENWLEKVDFNETVIRSKIGLAKAKIYPISSDLLWQYRKDRQPKTYEASQFSAFEKKLERILQHDRPRLIDVKDKILIQTVAQDLSRFFLNEINRGKEKEKQLKAQKQQFVERQSKSSQISLPLKRNLAAVNHMNDFMASTRQEFLHEFEAFIQIQELKTIETMGQITMDLYTKKTLEQIQDKVHQLRSESLARILDLLEREAGLEFAAKLLHGAPAPFPATPVPLQYQVVYKEERNQAGKGLAIGAAVGTLVFPLIGTAVGAVVGALVGNGLKVQPEIDLEATKNAIRNGTTSQIHAYFEKLTIHLQQEQAKWSQSVLQKIEHVIQLEDRKRSQLLANLENDLSACRRQLDFQVSLLTKLRLLE